MKEDKKEVERKSIRLIDIVKNVLFQKALGKEKITSEFRYRFEKMRKEMPTAPRWFVRNEVRKYFDPQGNIGTSLVSRAIKKEYGKILSRKERKAFAKSNGTYFIAISNR